MKNGLLQCTADRIMGVRIKRRGFPSGYPMNVLTRSFDCALRAPLRMTAGWSYVLRDKVRNVTCFPRRDTPLRITGQSAVFVILSGAKRSRRILPVLAEIKPIGILCLHKCIFLCPCPAFQLFFPGNRGTDIAGHLIIHQLIHMILFRKSIYEMVFMLIQAAFQIVRHADIHDPIVPVRENVHIIAVHGVLCVIHRYRGFARSFDCVLRTPLRMTISGS